MTLESFITIFKEVIVVIGSYKEEMINFLQKYNASQVIPVFNDQWDINGMSSSIKKGLEYVDQEYTVKGILIHPGDIPFISPNDINSIISEAKQKSFQKIIIPQYSQKHGHPVFIPKFLFSEVFKITEENEGLRGFMNQNNQYKIFVNGSKGTIKDIDKKEDVDLIK